MLVTVYVPTRNRRKLLERAVNSVLSQTYRDLEFIVVDDASTDDTQEYLQEVSRRDARLIVRRNDQPEGAPRARNFAIRAARGEFVTGLDDDDYFHSARIESFVTAWAALTSTGETPAFLYAQQIYVVDEREVFHTRKKGYLTSSDILYENHVGNQIFAPVGHVREAGLYNESMPAWQDLELFYRMLNAFGVGRLVDLHTYFLDLSPRPDRISALGERARRAFELFISLHPNLPEREKQALFLHVISPNYGIRPSPADWIRMIRWGFWPRGFARMGLVALGFSVHP